MKKQIIFLLLFFTSCSNNNISSSTITSITSSNKNTSSISNEITSIKSENPSQSTSITKQKIKIYLNPSVQTKNMYTGYKISEADTMNIVAKKAYNLLKKDNRFIVYINDSLKTLKESVNEINSFLRKGKGKKLTAYYDEIKEKGSDIILAEVGLKSRVRPDLTKEEMLELLKQA